MPDEPPLARRRPAGSAEGRPTPLGIDPTIPARARIYDYHLGGKTNYPVDRETAEKIEETAPFERSMARVNRYFLMRSVLSFADQGIRQFIDLGSGIPTSPNVHELARALQPSAHVLYVDNDSIAIAHSQHLLSGDQAAKAIRADIREPNSIHTSPVRRKLIDYGQPVGVLLIAVLHFVATSDHPQRLLREILNPLPGGSSIAISHITDDGADPLVVSAVSQYYENSNAPVVFRSEAEIAALLDDLDLLQPGIVEATRWLPYGGFGTSQPSRVPILTALASKNLSPYNLSHLTSTTWRKACGAKEVRKSPTSNLLRCPAHPSGPGVRPRPRFARGSSKPKRSRRLNC